MNENIPHFNLNKFKSAHKGECLGSTFWYFKSLPSTNSYLRGCYLPALTDGLVCLADLQTAGKGQYSRVWHGEEAANLTFTIVLLNVKNRHFHLLNMSVAATLVQFLRESYGLEAVLKWPNDVLVNQKKIAGFLTETAFIGKFTEKVLIGAGININQQKFDEYYADFACSLAHFTGKPVSREKFLVGFLKKIDGTLQLWKEEKLDVNTLINKNLLYYGEWVNASGFNNQINSRYKCLGVDNEGYLRLLNEDLEIINCRHEHVRLHKD